MHALWFLGTDDLDNAKKVLHDSLFLLYPLLFSSFIDARYVPRMLFALFVGMFTSEAISYWMYFDLPMSFEISNLQASSLNPTPIFNHLHYGFMLSVMACLSLLKIYYGDDSCNKKWFFFLFFLSSTINVFIITGRTGYILYAALLSSLVFFLYRRKLLVGLSIFIPFLLLVYVLAFNFSDAFHQRTSKTTQSIQRIIAKHDYDSSLGYRAAMYISSVQVLKGSWLTGLGTGDHLKAVVCQMNNDFPDIKHFISTLQHPHNEYLSAILQFGLIGLLAFLNIPAQMFRYRAGTLEQITGLKILAIGISLFSLVDIFVIGLGTLLITVTLCSLLIRHNTKPEMQYSPFGLRQFIIYGFVIAILQIL